MKSFVNCIFLFLVVFFSFPSSVLAIGGGLYGTPFPTMPLCSSGTCGTVCTSGLCPAGSTCTPFCNNNTGRCGMTCSAFQSTCTTGWGEWGSCTNGWQFRVCNNNAQLGQTQCCGTTECGLTTATGTQPQPTEETVIEPTATPAPVGAILARAVEIQPTDVTCDDVRAIPTTNVEIDGTTIGFTQSSASQPTPLTQSGANYVSFPSVLGGSYTIDPQPLGSNWMLAASCWTNSDGNSSTGFSTVLGDGETLQWDIGYMWGTSWVQTNGGDVYASGSLKSFIPDITPRVFSTNGTGGSPGVVTYGTTYDFDGGSVEQGADRVSSPNNWLVNETRSTVNYYDYFYRRYGSPTTTDNASFINLAAVEQPESRPTPYYIDGDMTTSGDWVVGDGENIVFIVTGNLTLGGQVNITGTGFAAFIVGGQYLSVSSSVGTTAAATAPVVEGVYVLSPSGTFQTGLSTSLGAAKFVGKGMFIAGNFLLQRDLDLYGGNTLYPPELFVYNPKLLVTMPDEMKELPVIWQEVAP